MSEAHWVVVACVAIATAGCDSRPKGAHPVASSSAASIATPAPSFEPPTRPFVLEPWRSIRKDVEPVAPPAELVTEWRAFVQQERPLQKKTPKWQPLPPKQAVTLVMPEGSAFRCIVNPLSIRAKSDEDEKVVLAWHVMRSLLCSRDDWKTWTEHIHQVVVAPGKEAEESDDRTEALLRERGEDGKVRETTIIIRSDPEKGRRATTGPPKIVPGAPVD